MHSINNELVKIGHGMSKEVAADEPAVAKLLTELSSALDVTTAAVRALQAERDQLAAECAAYKEKVLDITFMDDESFFGSSKKAQIVKGDLVNIKTPATDRFLADQRAQGVEMFAAHCQKRHGEMMKTEPNEHARNQAITATRRAGEFALYFAAQLRNEVKV